MTEQNNISIPPEELKKIVKESVREEFKHQRIKKLKKNLLIVLAGISCTIGGIGAAKHYLKKEFDKTEAEVRISAPEMQKEARKELDTITGTNKVLGAFGDMGGKFAKWLRIQQAKDKK